MRERERRERGRERERNPKQKHGAVEGEERHWNGAGEIIGLNLDGY